MEDSKATKHEDLQMPLLHGNGSGYENLSRQWEEAYTAVQEACRALSQCTPHGRDYYPLEDGAYQKAREEHQARGAKLCEVMDELAAMQHRLWDMKHNR